MDALAPDPELPVWAMVTPAAPLILAAILVALTPFRAGRKIVGLLGVAAAFGIWLAAEVGTYGVVDLGPFTLETFRFDGLSRLFGLAFIIAAGLTILYGAHERDRWQDTAMLAYAGAAVGGVFAGDLITLFMFWELTALTSVVLVWGGGGDRNRMIAGLRYFAVQVLSGVLLLAGAVIWATQTGSFAFGAALAPGAGPGGPYFDPATWGGGLLLAGIAIKAAFPLVHAWMADAYPRATPMGAVALSAFTTKLAIYALARGYAGFDPLILVGAVMAVFPVFYAMAEDDFRRIAVYGLHTQLGFMVCGVGVGSALALNGAAAHAVFGVLYIALMLMAAGAVLHRTGTARLSRLGGLAKHMPATAAFALIGAATISALPLFAGFVSKAMILSALLYEHYDLVWAALILAAAGVFVHSGLRAPWSVFFGPSSGRAPKAAPVFMGLSMAAAAFFCVYLAVPLPDGHGGIRLILSLLPYEAPYTVYTAGHVLTQLQLVAAAGAAVLIAAVVGLYPQRRDAVILDVDWPYRRPLAAGARWLAKALGALWVAGAGLVRRGLGIVNRRVQGVFSPTGALNRALPNGFLAIWTALMLGLALVLSLVAQ